MMNDTCSIEGCGKSRAASGYCRHHYNRAYRYGDPLGGPAEVTECLYCGKPTAKPKTGPRRHYCDAACKQRAQYEKDKAAGKYQSRNRAKPAADITCAVCGDHFTSPRKAARFCSKQCLREFYRDSPTRQCETPGCSRPVRAKNLCYTCYRRGRRHAGLEKYPEWDDRRRDNYHRRRALKKGASTGEAVELAAIAERDRWKCHLCGRKVSKARLWPHPESPSLDHVIPLTRGGMHDPSNVRLAHLRCNTAKGNRGGGEQLLLIG